MAIVTLFSLGLSVGLTIKMLIPAEATHSGIPHGAVLMFSGFRDNCPSGFELYAPLKGRFPLGTSGGNGGSGGSATHHHWVGAHSHDMDHFHVTAGAIAVDLGGDLFDSLEGDSDHGHIVSAAVDPVTEDLMTHTKAKAAFKTSSKEILPPYYKMRFCKKK